VAAKEINNRLDEIRAMALNIYTEQSAVRDGVTADEVKGVLLGMASGQETLLGYFKRFICNFEKRVGVNRTIGSLRAYRNAYNHIERFLQVQYKLSDIPFSALDRSFIDKYDLHLRTERNLAPGTIINLTVQLKTIVGEAIADGIITASPFLGYEPVRPKAVQKYLTAEELHRIMTTPLHRQTLYHVRDLFLFSCFTGISYGDMRLLTRDNLCLAEDGTWWIKSARQKTKIEFEIPLLDLPLQILKKYGDTAPSDKLLPVYCNSMLNLYLKEIAKICHIDRPLVFHTARHTYATEITLSHGVPLETVSKMLGHSQIETTQIYAKVTDDKIDADTKALNRKISECFSVIINNHLKTIIWKRILKNRTLNGAALLPCCFILTVRKCARTGCASYCAR
jgi:integrase/recombinase XerD